MCQFTSLLTEHFDSYTLRLLISFPAVVGMSRNASGEGGGGVGREGRGKAYYLMINQTHGTRETTKADLMLDFSLLKLNILKNT